MLYTLFSPAEAKEAGGSLPHISSKSFIFPSLYEKRLNVLNEFEKLKNSLSEKELLEFFELKSLNETSEYKESVFTLPAEKAILRYSGVAYKALDFYSLDEAAKGYLLDNVVIFSNLFGAIKGGDEIPNYKLKQGAKIGSLDTAKFYGAEFSSALDAMFEDAELVDLRAGYYEKFYKPKAKTLKPKFLKNGKIISHNAKEYRGLFLRAIAQNGAKNLEDITNINITNLRLIEIIAKKNITEPVFEVVDF